MIIKNTMLYSTEAFNKYADIFEKNGSIPSHIELAEASVGNAYEVRFDGEAVGIVLEDMDEIPEDYKIIITGVDRKAHTFTAEMKLPDSECEPGKAGDMQSVFTEAIIKKAANNEEASLNLQARFALSDKQANAIIQMRLGRLSHMETQQIIDELNELEIKIAFYKELLADEKKMLAEVEKEIRQVGEEYGDDRRTEIDIREVDGLVDKDFIKKEDVVVVITNKGFVKRVPADEYKSQGRGGKGVKGVSLRDESKQSSGGEKLWCSSGKYSCG